MDGYRYGEEQSFAIQRASGVFEWRFRCVCRGWNRALFENGKKSGEIDLTVGGGGGGGGIRIGDTYEIESFNYAELRGYGKLRGGEASDTLELGNSYVRTCR